MAAVLYTFLAAALHVAGTLSSEYLKDAGRFLRPPHTWDFGTFREFQKLTFPNSDDAFDYQLLQPSFLNKRDSAINFKWQTPVDDDVAPEYPRMRPRGALVPVSVMRGGFQPAIPDPSSASVPSLKADPEVSRPAIDTPRPTTTLNKDIHEFQVLTEGEKEYVDVNEETSKNAADNSTETKDTPSPNSQGIFTARGHGKSGSSIPDDTSISVDDSTSGTHGSTNLGEITNEGNQEQSTLPEDNQDNTHVEVETNRPALAEYKTGKVATLQEEHTDAEGGTSQPTPGETTETATEQEQNTGAEGRTSKPALGDEETTEQEEIQEKTSVDDKPDSSSATQETLSPDNQSISTREVSGHPSVVTEETDDSSASISDETTLSVRDSTGESTLTSHSDIRPSSAEPASRWTSVPGSRTASSATSESGSSNGELVTEAVTERDISISSIKTARMVLTVVFLVIGLIAIAVLAVYMFREKRRRVKYDQLTLLP